MLRFRCHSSVIRLLYNFRGVQMKIIFVYLCAFLLVGISLGGQFQGKSIDLNSLEPLTMQKGRVSALTAFEKSLKKSRSYHRLSSGEDSDRVIGYDPQKAGQGKRQLLGGSDLYKRCVKSVVLLVAMDATSLGSGSVLDEQGNILTNWHVVIGQDQMLVWPHDKKIGQLEDLDPDVAMLANVIAIDPDRDLAMLKLEPKSTIPQKIEIASIDPISIADDVFSIGHPEGYIWSFTYGVVSQIRSGFSWAYDEETDFKADVIQTQTPINPGNSGGPLFNGKGQLVGVNSFSYDGQGLNFAVHLREVNDFVSKANDGKYRDLSRNMSKETDAVVWEPLDINENGIPDAYRASIDNDDYYDAIKIDEDENGVIDFYGFDSTHDGSLNIYIFDEDGLEGYEHFYYDYDGDGEIDEHGIDEDGDGMPESVSEYSE